MKRYLLMVSVCSSLCFMGGLSHAKSFACSVPLLKGFANCNNNFNYKDAIGKNEPKAFKFKDAKPIPPKVVYLKPPPLPPDLKAKNKAKQQRKIQLEVKKQVAVALKKKAPPPIPPKPIALTKEQIKTIAIKRKAVKQRNIARKKALALERFKQTIRSRSTLHRGQLAYYYDKQSKTLEFNKHKPKPVYRQEWSSFSGTVSRASEHPIDNSRIINYGRYIKGILEDRVVSEIGGEFMVRITEDVYGYHSTVPLIPKDSQLFCSFQPLEKSKDTRLYTVCTRILLAETQQEILIQTQARDIAGTTGVNGEVNHRYYEKFFNAFAVTMLSAGIGYAKGEAEKKDNENLAEAGDELAKKVGDVAGKILDKSLNIPNILVKHRGEEIIIRPQHPWFIPLTN